MPYGSETTRADTYRFQVVRDSDNVDCAITIGPDWNAGAADADKDAVAQDVMDALAGMSGYTITAWKNLTGSSTLTPNP